MAGRRDHITVRSHGLEWMRQRATDEGLTKGNGEPNVSEFIRLCMAYARDNMPKGWRPKDWTPGV